MILAGAALLGPRLTIAGPGSATTSKAAASPAEIPGKKKIGLPGDHGKLPLGFEPNEGQADAPEAFWECAPDITQKQYRFDIFTGTASDSHSGSRLAQASACPVILTLGLLLTSVCLGILLAHPAESTQVIESNCF